MLTKGDAMRNFVMLAVVAMFLGACDDVVEFDVNGLYALTYTCEATECSMAAPDYALVAFDNGTAPDAVHLFWQCPDGRVWMATGGAAARDVSSAAVDGNLLRDCGGNVIGSVDTFVLDFDDHGGVSTQITIHGHNNCTDTYQVAGVFVPLAQWPTNTQDGT